MLHWPWHQSFPTESEEDQTRLHSETKIVQLDKRRTKLTIHTRFRKLTTSVFFFSGFCFSSDFTPVEPSAMVILSVDMNAMIITFGHIYTSDSFLRIDSSPEHECRMLAGK